MRYEGDTPVAVEKVLISAQHREGAEADIRDDLLETVIRPVMPEDLFDPGTAEILVNPTGRFVTGGPQGDTGLTGRKIIVDTYGGSAPHGGGAFSGQGRDEGRPLGLLRREVGGEEPRRGRTRRTVPGPGRLRHRRGPPRERDGGDVRYRKGGPRDPRARWCRSTSTSGPGPSSAT